MRAKIISAIYVILMLLSSFFMGTPSVNIHNAGIGAGSLNQAELPILYT